MLGRRREPTTRWERDNALRPNPAAFLAVALVAGAIGGLALLIWLV